MRRTALRRKTPLRRTVVMVSRSSRRPLSARTARALGELGRAAIRHVRRTRLRAASPKGRLAREIDNMLSVFVALRDRGRCRWCAGQKPEPMGASHFFPRGRWGTRYEPANLMWMHNSCNARAERERGASYRALMTTALGQAQFDVLAVSANARVVPTRAWLLAQKAKAEALVRSVLP